MCLEGLNEIVEEMKYIYVLKRRKTRGGVKSEWRFEKAWAEFNFHWTAARRAFYRGDDLDKKYYETEFFVRR